MDTRVRPWLASLTDAAFQDLRAAMSDESWSRDERAKLQAQSSSPLDSLDSEIAQLQAEWAADAERVRLERLERSRERCRDRAERARLGDLPDHFRVCKQCLKAVLEFRPREAGCHHGQAHQGYW